MSKKIRSINMVFRKQAFATDIKAARAELGMTLGEVGKHVSVSYSQIGKYENAMEDNPKLQNFVDICNLYDLNPQEYFELES